MTTVWHVQQLRSLPLGRPSAAGHTWSSGHLDVTDQGSHCHDIRLGVQQIPNKRTGKIGTVTGSSRLIVVRWGSRSTASLYGEG